MLIKIKLRKAFSRSVKIVSINVMLCFALTSLKLSADEPKEFSCKTEQSKVTLKTAGATYLAKVNSYCPIDILSDNGAYSLNLYAKDQFSENLGQLIIKSMESAERGVDTDNKKAVNIHYSLQYEKTQRAAPYKLEVKLAIKKDSPCVYLTSEMQNEKEEENDLTFFWFFSVPMKSITFARADDTNIKTCVLEPKWTSWNNKKMDWCYFQPVEAGNGIGLIQLASPIRISTSDRRLVNFGPITSPKKVKKGDGIEFSLAAFPAASVQAAGKIAMETKLAEKMDAASMELPGGKSYLCRQTTATPKIDGNLDEWKGIAPIVLDRRDQIHDCTTIPWNGPEDLSARIWLAYDKTNLYFAAETTDNVIYNQERMVNEIWRGDCIQIGFDTLSKRTSGHYNADDYEYTFALTSNGPQVACWQQPPDKGKDNITLAICPRSNGKGLVYEAAIPWKDLEPFQIEKGSMGFNVIVADNDGYGWERWADWSGGGVAGGKNPSLFGTLHFEGSIENYLKQIEKKFATLLSLPRKEYIEGEPIVAIIQVYTLEPVEKAPIRLQITSETNNVVVFETTFETNLAKGVNAINYTWQTEKLPGGKYDLIVISDMSKSKLFDQVKERITIFNISDIRQKIDLAKETCRKLEQLVVDAKSKGINVPYQLSALRLMKDFIPYIDNELQRKEIVHYWDRFSLPTGKPVGQRAKNGTYPKWVIPVEGEVRRFILSRADINSDYLLAQGRKAIEETKALLSDPSTQIIIPDYDLSQIGIKGGCFSVEDKPIIMVGPIMHSNESDLQNHIDFIPFLREYGFQLVRFSSGSTAITTNVLKICRENNIAVTITYNRPYLTDPLRRLTGGGKSFDDSGMAEIVKQDVEKWVRPLLAAPAPFSYVLGPIEERYISYNPETTAAFRAELQKKYGTVESFNSVMKTNYTGFQEVTVPKDGRNPAIWYDWCMFNESRVTGFVRSLRDQIRTVEARKPPFMGIGAQCYLWNYDYVKCGNNYEELAQLGDIFDHDSGRYYGRGGEFPFNFQESICLLDLVKSFVPEKPIMDCEWHFIQDADPSYYPYGFGRAALWQSCLHGLSAIELWAWERSDTRNMFWNNFHTRAEVTDAISRTALDLQRLAKYVTRFPMVKGKIAILYSVPSILGPNYLSELKKTYVGLFFSGHPVKFISEAQIAEGKLADYQLLIVPEAKRVHEKTYGMITEFIRNGGTAFITKGSLMQDEHGEIRNTHDFFQDKADYSFGRGRIIQSAPSTEQDYFQTFTKIAKELGINGDIQAADDKGEIPWGIEWRQASIDGGKIVYLINLRKESAKISLISSRGDIKKIVNLLTNREEKNEFMLPSMEVFLLEIR